MHLLSACYMSGTLLKPTDTPINKTDKNASVIAVDIQADSKDPMKPALQSPLACLRDG